MVTSEMKDAVRNLAATSELNKKIFESMNIAEVVDNEITVDSIIEDLDQSDDGKRKTALRSKVTELLKSLSQTGAGKYLVGRHGRPSRFSLSVPHSDLMDAVGVDDLEETQSEVAA